MDVKLHDQWVARGTESLASWGSSLLSLPLPLPRVLCSGNPDSTFPSEACCCDRGGDPGFLSQRGCLCFFFFPTKAMVSQLGGGSKDSVYDSDKLEL